MTRRPIEFTRPAVPAPGLEERLERRRHVGDERRAHRHVEVAHAVEVAERAGAVGHAGVAGRVALGELDERLVEGGEGVAQLVRARRGHRIAGGVEPVERGEAPRADAARSAVALERRPKVALGMRPGRDPDLGVERLGQRLHGPGLEVDVAAADELRRSGREAAGRRPRSGPRPADRRSRSCRSSRSSAAGSSRRSPRARAPGWAWSASARRPSGPRSRARPGSARSRPPGSARPGRRGSGARTRPRGRTRRGPRPETRRFGRRSPATAPSRRQGRSSRTHDDAIRRRARGRAGPAAS